VCMYVYTRMMGVCVCVYDVKFAVCVYVYMCVICELTDYNYRSLLQNVVSFIGLFLQKRPII